MKKSNARRKLRTLSILSALILLVSLAPSTLYAKTTVEEKEIEVQEKEKEVQQQKKAVEENEEIVRAEQQEYEHLKGELEIIGANIEAARQDKAAAEEVLSSLREEQALILEMIALNEAEISQTQGQLDAKQDEVAKTREELYQNDQLYQQRLVAIYEMNNASVLSQVLSVENFTDFFQVVDAMQRISENDTQLLAEQSERKAQLEREETEIKHEIDTLSVVHEELAANNSALEVNKSQQQELASEAANRESAHGQEYESTDQAAGSVASEIEQAQSGLGSAQAGLEQAESELEQARIELEQAQAEMDQARQAVAATGTQEGDGSPYVGGVFQWPVPGFYNITCYFGAPDPNGTPHRGMDISGGGVMGANIVACGNGTVITSSSHSSYGNYIVIDHGDGIKTLYAHCSSLLRGVGETVQAGDVIATVGSTGFSTGAHLHLEVQTGGGLKNPLDYLR